jgi:hypothetical protein
MREPRLGVAAPDAVFAPEQYLPSQLAQARRDSLICGEKALLLAVLEDAIRCLDARSTSRAHLAREAERWVRAEDHDWPFSFVNVCGHLDVDPQQLRAALLARRSRRRAAASSAREGAYRLHLRLKPPRRRLRSRGGASELPRRAAQG